MSLKAFRDCMTLLRLPYNFIILSGGFLAGGLLAGDLHVLQFLVAFLIAEVLLMGGMNLFNSYYDRDEGPIGGLLKPPPVPKEALTVSMFLQLLAVVLLAFRFSLGMAGVAVFSIILSTLYSHPTFRWKGKPHLSLLSVGLGDTLLVGLGFLAAGGVKVSPAVFFLAVSFGCFSLAFYPISQIYQIQQDLKNNDFTFAAKYRKKGVQDFFVVMFFVGSLLLFLALKTVSGTVALFILAACGGIGFFTFHKTQSFTESVEDYALVMRLKMIGGVALSVGSIALLLTKF